MIRLNKITRTFGDETSGYEVSMDKKYTIKNFIEEVIFNNQEWGCIGIKEDNIVGFILGNPNCEYRYGKLLSHIPDEYMDKEILFATANGGWGRMDYKLKIRES